MNCIILFLCLCAGLSQSAAGFPGAACGSACGASCVRGSLQACSTDADCRACGDLNATCIAPNMLNFSADSLGNATFDYPCAYPFCSSCSFGECTAALSPLCSWNSVNASCDAGVPVPSYSFCGCSDNYTNADGSCVPQSCICTSWKEPCAFYDEDAGFSYGFITAARVKPSFARGVPTGCAFNYPFLYVIRWRAPAAATYYFDLSGSALASPTEGPVVQVIENSLGQCSQLACFASVRPNGTRTSTQQLPLSKNQEVLILIRSPTLERVILDVRICLEPLYWSTSSALCTSCPATCTGHGSCSRTTDDCTCNAGWASQGVNLCSVLGCVAEKCSGTVAANPHGTCPDGLTDAQCAQRRIKGSCSSSGSCSCTPGWTGQHCRCPLGNAACDDFCDEVIPATLCTTPSCAPAPAAVQSVFERVPRQYLLPLHITARIDRTSECFNPFLYFSPSKLSALTALVANTSLSEGGLLINWKCGMLEVAWINPTTKSLASSRALCSPALGSEVGIDVRIAHMNLQVTVNASDLTTCRLTSPTASLAGLRTTFWIYYGSAPTEQSQRNPAMWSGLRIAAGQCMYSSLCRSYHLACTKPSCLTPGVCGNTNGRRTNACAVTVTAASSAWGVLSTDYKCTCVANFTGPTCSCAAGFYPSPAESTASLAACSIKCVNGKLNSTGACACSKGWTGTACDSCATGWYPSGKCTSFCSAEMDCLGRGHCDTKGACVCLPGYSGGNCAIVTCGPGTLCNGGTCDSSARNVVPSVATVGVPRDLGFTGQVFSSLSGVFNGWGTVRICVDSANITVAQQQNPDMTGMVCQLLPLKDSVSSTIFEFPTGTLWMANVTVDLSSSPLFIVAVSHLSGASLPFFLIYGGAYPTQAIGQQNYFQQTASLSLTVSVTLNTYTVGNASHTLVPFDPSQSAELRSRSFDGIYETVESPTLHAGATLFVTFDQSDPALAQDVIIPRLSTRQGISCPFCPSNLMGRNCELCQPGYYPAAYDSDCGFNTSLCCSLKCGCNLQGTVMNTCSFVGWGQMPRCICNPGFSGRRCDSCAAGYYPQPPPASTTTPTATQTVTTVMMATFTTTTTPSPTTIRQRAKHRQFDVLQEATSLRSCSVYCDSVLNCSTHGQCSNTGQCVCDEGWQGPNCEIETCTSSTCAGGASCAASFTGVVRVGEFAIHRLRWRVPEMMKYAVSNDWATDHWLDGGEDAFDPPGFGYFHVCSGAHCTPLPFDASYGGGTAEVVTDDGMAFDTRWGWAAPSMTWIEVLPIETSRAFTLTWQGAFGSSSSVYGTHYTSVIVNGQDVRMHTRWNNDGPMDSVEGDPQVTVTLVPMNWGNRTAVPPFTVVRNGVFESVTTLPLVVGATIFVQWSHSAVQIAESWIESILVGENTITCSCPTGAVGSRCEYCAPGKWHVESGCSLACPCLNGGTCDAETGECSCPSGFAGGVCEICEKGLFPPPTAGVSNPCSKYCDDSTCEFGYCNIFNTTCTCSVGVTGQYCEVKHCTAGFCKNGGTCIDPTASTDKLYFDYWDEFCTTPECRASISARGQFQRARDWDSSKGVWRDGGNYLFRNFGNFEICTDSFSACSPLAVGGGNFVTRSADNFTVTSTTLSGSTVTVASGWVDETSFFVRIAVSQALPFRLRLGGTFGRGLSLEVANPVTVSQRIMSDYLSMSLGVAGVSDAASPGNKPILAWGFLPYLRNMSTGASTFEVLEPTLRQVRITSPAFQSGAYLALGWGKFWPEAFANNILQGAVFGLVPSCICQTGFAGDVCETCAGGYFGDSCQCGPSSCNQINSGGNCSADGTCACSTGYTGSDCQQCQNGFAATASTGASTRCQPSCLGDCNSVKGRGTCVSPGVCRCNAGWTGSICEEPVISMMTCAGDNCTYADFVPQFTGSPTQIIRISVCPITCVHGTCAANSRSCVCQPGWSGSACVLPDCSSRNCSGHGWCSAPSACTCEPGWEGVQCELSVCGLNTDCTTCIKNGCGWCETTNTCLPGDSDGPYGNVLSPCTSWFYGTCVTVLERSDRGQPVPCSPSIQVIDCSDYCFADSSSDECSQCRMFLTNTTQGQCPEPLRVTNPVAPGQLLCKLSADCAGKGLCIDGMCVTPYVYGEFLDSSASSGVQGRVRITVFSNVTQIAALACDIVDASTTIPMTTLYIDTSLSFSWVWNISAGFWAFTTFYRPATHLLPTAASYNATILQVSISVDGTIIHVPVVITPIPVTVVSTTVPTAPTRAAAFDGTFQFSKFKFLSDELTTTLACWYQRRPTDTCVLDALTERFLDSNVYNSTLTQQAITLVQQANTAWLALKQSNASKPLPTDDGGAETPEQVTTRLFKLRRNMSADHDLRQWYQANVAPLLAMDIAYAYTICGCNNAPWRSFGYAPLLAKILSGVSVGCDYAPVIPCNAYPRKLLTQHNTTASAPVVLVPTWQLPQTDNLTQSSKLLPYLRQQFPDVCPPGSVYISTGSNASVNLCGNVSFSFPMAQCCLTLLSCYRQCDANLRLCRLSYMDCVAPFVATTYPFLVNATVMTPPVTFTKEDLTEIALRAFMQGPGVRRASCSCASLVCPPRSWPATREVTVYKTIAVATAKARLNRTLTSFESSLLANFTTNYQSYFANCDGQACYNKQPPVLSTSWRCLCYSGWTGPVCDVPVCPQNCSGHGVCRVGNGDIRPLCQCHTGWYGEVCARTDGLPASVLADLHFRTLDGASGANLTMPGDYLYCKSEQQQVEVQLSAHGTTTGSAVVAKRFYVGFRNHSFLISSATSFRPADIVVDGNLFSYDPVVTTTVIGEEKLPSATLHTRLLPLTLGASAGLRDAQLPGGDTCAYPFCICRSQETCQMRRACSWVANACLPAVPVSATTSTSISGVFIAILAIANGPLLHFSSIYLPNLGAQILQLVAQFPPPNSGWSDATGLCGSTYNLDPSDDFGNFKAEEFNVFASKFTLSSAASKLSNFDSLLPTRSESTSSSIVAFFATASWFGISTVDACDAVQNADLRNSCHRDTLAIADGTLSVSNQYWQDACPSGCSFSGHCVSAEGCICVPPYSGGDCSSKPCYRCLAGVCTDDGFCECYEGWSSPSSGCDRQSALPRSCPKCANSGQCDNGVCICQGDWTGPLCDVRITGLTASRDDGNQFAVCTWAEDNGISLCDNGGQCAPLASDWSNVVCVCPTGFSGPLCQTLVCRCANNGVCSSSGSCQCADAWSGTSCSLPTCSAMAYCSGHGQCYIEQHTHSQMCNCTSNWGGSACAIPICGNACGSHGRCEYDPSNGEQPSCACAPGWTGSTCSAVLVCPELENCYGNGFCVNASSESKCACFNGYRGRQCELTIEAKCEPTWEGLLCGQTQNVIQTSAFNITLNTWKNGASVPVSSGGRIFLAANEDTFLFVQLDGFGSPLPGVWFSDITTGTASKARASKLAAPLNIGTNADFQWRVSPRSRLSIAPTDLTERTAGGLPRGTYTMVRPVDDNEETFTVVVRLLPIDQSNQNLKEETILASASFQLVVPAPPFARPGFETSAIGVVTDLALTEITSPVSLTTSSWYWLDATTQISVLAYEWTFRFCYDSTCTEVNDNSSPFARKYFAEAVGFSPGFAAVNTFLPPLPDASSQRELVIGLRARNSFGVTSPYVEATRIVVHSLGQPALTDKLSQLAQRSAKQISDTDAAIISAALQRQSDTLPVSLMQSLGKVSVARVNSIVESLQKGTESNIARTSFAANLLKDVAAAPASAEAVQEELIAAVLQVAQSGPFGTIVPLGGTAEGLAVASTLLSALAIVAPGASSSGGSLAALRAIGTAVASGMQINTRQCVSGGSDVGACAWKITQQGIATNTLGGCLDGTVGSCDGSIGVQIPSGLQTQLFGSGGASSSISVGRLTYTADAASSAVGGESGLVSDIVALDIFAVGGETQTTLQAPITLTIPLRPESACQPCSSANSCASRADCAAVFRTSDGSWNKSELVRVVKVTSTTTLNKFNALDSTQTATVEVKSAGVVSVRSQFLPTTTPTDTRSPTITSTAVPYVPPPPVKPVRRPPVAPPIALSNRGINSAVAIGIGVGAGILILAGVGILVFIKGSNLMAPRGARLEGGDIEVGENKRPPHSTPAEPDGEDPKRE